MLLQRAGSAFACQSNTTAQRDHSCYANSLSSLQASGNQQGSDISLTYGRPFLIHTGKKVAHSTTAEY